MRRPRGVRCHVCAPQRDRRVPNISGDYDFDASILHSTNSDMANRLEYYVAKGPPGYGPLTGYSAYSNYSGDT
jgi:hypothetical protein